MRQRHRVVGLAAVCLAGLFAGAGAAGQEKTCAGQTGCRSRMNPCESLFRGGEVRNGEVIFRIAYDDDVDDAQKKAFKAGMEMWNKRRKDTGFAFDDAKTIRKEDGSVSIPHEFRLQKGAPRHFEDTDRATFERDQCAVYETLGSYIWYSPGNMKAVIDEVSLQAAARVYAHELGHALNICHKPESDLMREGFSKVFCQERASKMPDDIPEDDVQDAKGCGDGVRAMAREEDIVLAVLGRSRRLRQVGRQFRPWMPFVPLPTFLQ